MSKDYFKPLKEIFSQVQVKDRRGQILPIDAAIPEIIKLILKRSKKSNKVILIGNGGSASIASHIAIDFLKNCNVPALAFNDSSFLTCISNDLGFEQVFQKPIEVLGEKEDILFAISSSGKSKNILNAALKAKQKRCFVVTLSGFAGNNPLRRMGDINFYVPSFSYGDVEITHLAICHAIVDNLITKKDG